MHIKLSLPPSQVVQVAQQSTYFYAWGPMPDHRYHGSIRDAAGSLLLNVDFGNQQDRTEIISALKTIVLCARNIVSDGNWDNKDVELNIKPGKIVKVSDVIPSVAEKFRR
ncbi:MAG: hypothetical protein HZC01_04945 [Candidatus Kerfeldbacteria bacterium]|nr:hypothetical protein [Candidatus Kerfeldbacteria bacterium]